MSKMTDHRKISLTAGILYLLTFVSIPTLALYSQAKSQNYIVSPNSDTSAIVGGILEIIVALAAIATAVVLFPMLKKQNETGALGLVAARVLEASSIFVGVAFMLTVVTLHQKGAGPDSLAISDTLVMLYDRMFLLSQRFMPAICDLILGILLFRSRLVPRGLSTLGIVGAPLLIAGYFAVMFGATDQGSSVAGLSAIGVALFEFLLGLWLVVKGFNPKAVAMLDSKAKRL